MKQGFILSALVIALFLPTQVSAEEGADSNQRPQCCQEYCQELTPDGFLHTLTHTPYDPKDPILSICVPSLPPAFCKAKVVPCPRLLPPEIEVLVPWDTE